MVDLWIFIFLCRLFSASAKCSEDGSDGSKNCSASNQPDESEHPTGIGAILGPTITIFILIDVAAVVLVYYILKRRMRLKGRASISDRRDHSKDDGSGRPRGNNYVGIRSQGSVEDRYIQAIDEEYEDVGSNVRQAPLKVPQKKKGWFNLFRSQNAVSEPISFQPTDEYEEVVEPKKKKIPKSPKICPKAPPVPVEVDWTPADEYEEVEVSIPTSGYRKDKVSETADLQSMVQARTPKSWARKSKKISTDDNLQPKECYEEMNTVTPKTKRKLRRAETFPEKKEMISQAANRRRADSPVLSHTCGSTEANASPTQKMKRLKPVISPKSKASHQPTDVYDNAEMFSQPPRESQPNLRKKPILPKRVRTVTEPVNPNQIYDNFERIMEVENKSRANSLKIKK